jgi:hypothetical protein
MAASKNKTANALSQMFHLEQTAQTNCYEKKMSQQLSEKFQNVTTLEVDEIEKIKSMMAFHKNSPLIHPGTKEMILHPDIMSIKVRNKQKILTGIVLHCKLCQRMKSERKKKLVQLIQFKNSELFLGVRINRHRGSHAQNVLF